MLTNKNFNDTPFDLFGIGDSVRFVDIKLIRVSNWRPEECEQKKTELKSIRWSYIIIRTNYLIIEGEKKNLYSLGYS